MNGAAVIETMRRIDGHARAAEAAARRAEDCVADYHVNAILEELTGREMDADRRREMDPGDAGLVCLSKSIRFLAAMVAERYGETISVAGALDDL